MVEKLLDNFVRSSLKYREIIVMITFDSTGLRFDVRRRDNCSAAREINERQRNFPCVRRATWLREFFKTRTHVGIGRFFMETIFWWKYGWNFCGHSEDKLGDADNEKWQLFFRRDLKILDPEIVKWVGTCRRSFALSSLPSRSFKSHFLYRHFPVLTWKRTIFIITEDKQSADTQNVYYFTIHRYENCTLQYNFFLYLFS